MNEAFNDLVLLSVMFVGSHFLLSHPPVRKFLIHRWREGPYRVVYATIVGILFVQMLQAFKATPDVDLPFVALTMVPVYVMPLACILIFCGYTIGNPSAVGFENLGKEKPVPGILKITRQPAMWGTGLFLLSHMAANPRVAEWIFFGALAVLALLGSYFLDRRKLDEGHADWKALVAQSSFVPFAAVLTGRTRVTPGQIGWLRLLGGLVLFAALLAAHEAVIGVAPLPPELMLKIQG